MDERRQPKLLTIGQLARRSGVSARTIRFWSDIGVLPESDRSTAGHRRYDARAVARLDLVKTLRALGMSLDDVREVLERRRTVDDVARAHVDALDQQIRALRVQRAVCALLARGPHTEKETVLMNHLAQLSAAERQEMIDNFVTEAFAGVDPTAPGAGIAQGMRRLPPTLPDEPSVEQVQAWVELAELVGDASFRARVREMALAGAKGGDKKQPFDPALVMKHAGAAVKDGVAPTAADAAEVLARIGVGALSSTERVALANDIDGFTDRRVERYWALLGVLNGRPAFPPSTPAFEWLAAALRGAAH